MISVKTRSRGSGTREVEEMEVVYYASQNGGMGSWSRYRTVPGPSPRSRSRSDSEDRGSNRNKSLTGLSRSRPGQREGGREETRDEGWPRGERQFRTGKQGTRGERWTRSGETVERAERRPAIRLRLSNSKLRVTGEKGRGRLAATVPLDFFSCGAESGLRRRGEEKTRAAKSSSIDPEGGGWQ